jgi:hypothetical protein
VIENKQKKVGLFLVTGLQWLWRVSTGEAKTGLFMLNAAKKA